MSIRLTVHSTGGGVCSLTSKQAADGLTVSFDDGTVKESFLSWRAFRQLLSLKAGHSPKPDAKTAAPSANAVPAGKQ